MKMRQVRRRRAGGVALVVGLALLIGLLSPVTQRAMASVTLNYFRATWKPDLETVAIEWQTATELNTVGFIVERSTAPNGTYTAITAVIPAQGDQLTGYTYQAADDPTTVTLGTTYWYRLIVINSSPPNDTINPVAVLAGEVNTVTPTATATATTTSTPSLTPTRTRTPTPSNTPTTPVGGATATATTRANASGPEVTPSVTFVSIGGATVTPRPVPPVGATVGAVPVATLNVRPSPDSRLVSTPTAADVASAVATPLLPVAQNTQPTAMPFPTAVPPTLVPTNATFVAVAPVVVPDESATTPAADPEPTGGNSAVLVMLSAAGVLLLGGLYAILRQTKK